MSRPPWPRRRPRLTPRQRRRGAVTAGLAVLAVIGVVSVLLAPGAGAPHRAAPARTAAPRPAGCARADGRERDFPVGARIHGGPGTYRGGDPYQDWAIDLENRTPTICRSVYPVVVLVDSARALGPGQVRLEFHDGTRWRRVPMVHTDRDELVGAFGTRTGFRRPDFPGFTLRPGSTLTVRVRLALTADAEPTDVVAVAAVVQRHGDDGDWVGESARYRFEVVTGT